MKYLICIAALLLCGCSCNPDKMGAIEIRSDRAADSIQNVQNDDLTRPMDDRIVNADDDNDSAEIDDASKDVRRGDKIIKSNKNGIDIVVRYPERGNEKIDSVIRNKAEKAAKAAQNRLDAMRAENQNPMQVYSYELGYDVVREGTDSADVVFTHSEYSGGAHESIKLETVMLDGEGNTVDPWSLFEDVDAELIRMSREARKQLLERHPDIDGFEQMIQKGTEPSRENFKHMVRTEDGVRVYFEPYTIAPGSEGVLYFDYKLQ